MIDLIPNPGDAELDAILAPLAAHNDAAAGPTERHKVALVLRDEAGAAIGGLWAEASYRWLFVKYLALPPEARGKGQGRALMLAAEDEARRLGCVGIWLDTFSFQARGFYEKLGYGVFGRIDDYPPGEARFFLSKRLDQPNAPTLEPSPRV